MKVHVISRSPWHEPHRIRQQLSILIADKYDVVYHQPCKVDAVQPIEGKGAVRVETFSMIKRFMSFPVVTLFNFLFVRNQFKRKLEPGDIVLNFLPEIMFFKIKGCVNVISVFNDDFASMAPKYSSWWIKLMMIRMAENSDHCLYVSSKLMEKYPSNGMSLFYPWCDEGVIEKKNRANVILYWGYISEALDFDVIEDIVKQIESGIDPLEFWLVGPVSPGINTRVNWLRKRYPCVKLHDPMFLHQLDASKVLCGVELISPKFANGHVVEFPNKAPRLLSIGVPLVYSGCNLASEPFFIKYEGDVEQLVRYLDDNYGYILKCIDSYFIDNNSRSRLRLFDSIVSAFPKSGG